MARLQEIRAKKYPIVIRSWLNNGESLPQYFKYPEDLRWIICTTNIIEAVHRQSRKLTKKKRAFSNEDSLLRQLSLGIQKRQQKVLNSDSESGARTL